MARRRGIRARARRRHSRGGAMGMGFLNKRFLPTGGFLQGVLLGAGAAELAENSGVASIVPGGYGKYLAGAAVGGILPGTLGVIARDVIKNIIGGGSGGSGGVSGYSY